jgi:enoyl-CoA hydratase/carnithine racemase
MTSTILFEQEAGIATLRFNRPDRRNALGREELSGIQLALGALKPETRVLVITSTSGSTFCAGADLQQIRAGELDGDQFQQVTNELADLPIPTLCAINGNVFGGGCELAMSCDFRLASQDIKMRVPASAIGLCYPIEGIERFVSRLGVSVAKRILVAAEEFSAEQMLEFGIVSQLFSTDSLIRESNLMAKMLAQRAPLAVAAMLKVIRQAERGSINQQEARDLAAICSDSDDLKEGLLAQKERRPAVFKGC